LVPIAREKEYTSLSPTISGPVIVAVARSGYWAEFPPFLEELRE